MQLRGLLQENSLSEVVYEMAEETLQDSRDVLQLSATESKVSPIQSRVSPAKSRESSIAASRSEDAVSELCGQWDQATERRRALLRRLQTIRNDLERDLTTAYGKYYSFKTHPRRGA